MKMRYGSQLVFVCLASLGLGLVVPACNGPVRVRPLGGMTDDRQRLDPRTGPGLVADPASPIPDVPIPVGFKALPALCAVELTPQGRSVEHVYQGLADMEDAASFYSTNLWRFGWVRESMEITPGKEPAAVLAYTKGPERLDIQALGDGRVTLQINISPR